MNTFDPNQPGVANGGYFALPFQPEDASIVLLSAPWDVTTSYRAGTHLGPQAIIDASVQVDLYDPLVPNAWDIPIATIPCPEELTLLNAEARSKAEEVIAAWEEGREPDEATLEAVNESCARMNRMVYGQCREQLRNGKCVGLVGGEHSVPLGYLQALSEMHEAFGILHIDAHADLRKAYEGFTYSHASIMYNTLITVGSVTTLAQVGIRDFCQDEADLVRDEPRIAFFPDHELQQALFEGATWQDQCARILDSLPEKVYISLDIDGLSPEHCPHTGTPVPGGLTFRQVDYLLHSLAKSSKNIIGFDLCEVAPGPDDEWDANVGARILYKLCTYAHLNHKN